MAQKEKGMASPYLSICIPTYNREPFLRENIEQLLQEIKKTPEGLIEIVISDNASTDNTQSYCEKLQALYPFVTYIRNPENQGPNANFQQVLALANGVYGWLLGDDDKIVEDCLDKIINDSKAYREPEIIIGGCINDLTRQRIYPPFTTTPLNTDKAIFNDYSGIRLAGKISVIIFKRASLLSILKTAENVIRTLKTPWPHLVWLILMLNENGRILFLPYGTNYFLEKNRSNVLQDGNTGINISVMEYAALIYQLNTLHLLSTDFNKILVHSITHHRQFEFIKLMGYSTYCNCYFSGLKNAFCNLFFLKEFYNKINFFTFFVFPMIFPIFLRKFLLNSIAFFTPQWGEYQKYLSYIKKYKAFFKKENKRNIFHKDDL